VKSAKVRAAEGFKETEYDMPNDVEAEIRARLEQFATRLTALIQQSAMSSVEDAFGGSTPARRGRGGRSAAVVAPRAPRGRKGQKRDPALLEALTEKLGSFIAKNPGQRIEQIGQSLGVATKDLALPVKKLILAKRVSTKGQKRATTYFAGGGRGGKRGPKPAKAKAGKAVKPAKAAKSVKAAKAPKARKANKAPVKRSVKAASAKKSVKPSAPAAPASDASSSAAE
jgi:hypothetical protein